MKKRNFFIFSLAILLLFIVSIISLGVGRYPIPIEDIIKIIFNRDIDGTIKSISTFVLSGIIISSMTQGL